MESATDEDTMVTAPGIVDGMPAEIYHADPCPAPALSNSIIKPLLQQSPFHAWLQHPRLNPQCQREDDSKYDLGTAAHAMLLEGADRCEPIDYADWRTNDSKALRDLAWKEGKTPLLRATYQAAQVMVLRAREFLETTEFAGALSHGKPEQSFFWREVNGIWVKARADWMTDDRRLILDFKTTGLAPRKWQRAMTENHYHTQATLYLRGMSTLGHPGCRFVFLIQESHPPYSCWLVEAAESLRELGGMQIARAVRLWAECLKNKHWPGYPTSVQPAFAPNWAMQEEMEQE